MYCLNVLGMVVSPRTSHPWEPAVVGQNLAVIREGYAADCALSRIARRFFASPASASQKATELAISSGVLCVFDAQNTKLKSAFSSGLLATAAKARPVYRTGFNPSEVHGNAPA